MTTAICDAIQALLGKVPLVMWATDADLRIRWIRGGSVRMLGMDQMCVIDATVDGMFGSSDHPVAACHRRALGGESHSLQVEWLDRSYEMWIEALRSENGNIEGVIAVALDVTDARRAERAMMEQASSDALTGALNRARLCERQETMLHQARRSGCHLAVVLVGVDGFSSINDAVGDSAADELLRGVHERIRNAVPAAAAIARVGADEFAIAVADTSVDEVDILCAHLHRRLRESLAAAGQQIHVGVSIGSAIFPRDGATVERLLRSAAAAVRHARDSGGGQSHGFSPALAIHSRQRLQIDTDLRRAIDRQELFLVYQPQVDLADGSLVGAEVLLRWRKDGEILPASSFIRHAEECALIVPIGEWVIETAIAQLAEWRRHGLNLGRLAINVGARQLADNSIVTAVWNALEKHQVPGTAIEIEITETAAMKDAETAARVIEELRAIGVEVAIDDFGTGYSSLSYLKRFAVTALKIDRAFVADLPESETAAAIVSAILATARVFGIRVVAEGVEKESQAERLHRDGCAEAQGNYYSYPLTAESMTHYLRAIPAARRSRRSRDR